MAETRIRLYKYLTPPKTGGATISVGNKTITGDNFATTIKAVNSLGATVNSIGLALLKQQKLQMQQQQAAARANQLAADRAREGKIEAGSSRSSVGDGVGAIAGRAKGFLEGLLETFGKLFIFGALDWLSDPENKKKIENVVNKMKTFFKWMVDTFNNIAQFTTGAWNDSFGEGSPLDKRIKGAAKLALVAGGALLGLSFLKNPVGTVKNFSSLLGLVGKGILNLGKFLGGNVAGQGLMAGAIGFRSYQLALEDESIPEEDRQAAAIGSGVGAAGGAMALSMIGNQIAGPIGGMIGSALGGFLGKEAGKFLGPIVDDFFKTMKKVFDTVMDFLKSFFKPLGDAIKDLFKAMGPVIQKTVDFIKPHIPMLKKVTEFLGTVAFAPLIGLLKGLTAVLKWVGGGTVGEDVNNAINAATGTGAAKAGELPEGMVSGDLASFIGAVESGNDYTKLVGGKRDQSILKKTISQLSQEKGGQFAMGRYQIQMRTAAEVLRNAGKDPNKFLFDKKGQDYIYQLLLKRRGLDKFKQGKITKEQFAKNLSMEWAALPAGAHNRSYYAGDGKNKAHRTWQDTLSILERTKGRSKGGWISGPQSGYPVSLTGKGVDFIGHGTEYVAQKSSGGFVIPFDTPHTRMDPGLTGRRIREAQSGGYLKSAGGLLPGIGLSSILGMAGKVAANMIGGMASRPQMPSYAGNALASMNNTVSTSVASANTSAQALTGILNRIKQISSEVESGDLKNLIDMAVAQAIQLPVDTKPAAAPSIPIPLPSKENPATSFLTSRFGRTAELSNALSNFF